MRIHIDTTFFIKDLYRINKIRKLADKTTHDIYLYPSSHMSYITLFVLLSSKKYSSVNLTIPAKHFSGLISLCLAHSKKVNVLITVDKTLSQKLQKRIKRTNALLYVKDYSDGKNFELYSNCRNLVVNDQIQQFACLNALSENKTPFSCEFSSCLGKNIYINRYASMYFCKKHTDSTYLGELENSTNLWDKEIFGDILRKAILKRNNCKDSCAFYINCHGGCPLSDKCNTYKTEFNDSLASIEHIVSQNEELDKLPLYQSDSIINYLTYKTVRNNNSRGNHNV